MVNFSGRFDDEINWWYPKDWSKLSRQGLFDIPQIFKSSPLKFRYFELLQHY